MRVSFRALRGVALHLSGTCTKHLDWVFARGDPERALGRDAIFDNISRYWLTNTGTSSGRIHWETATTAAKPAPILIPVAVTIFPGEVYQSSKRCVARAFQNLIYYNRVDKGGHFAAWEEPELFGREVRSAFQLVR